MEKIIEKLEEISSLLKVKNNNSFHFFEDLALQIKNGNEKQAIRIILKSGAITQYSNFDYKQQDKYEELYAIALELDRL